MTVLTSPGNDEERLKHGYFFKPLIVFNYSICGAVSLLYHWRAICFSEKAENHWSSLCPSPTWKMGKKINKWDHLLLPTCVYLKELH